MLVISLAHTPFAFSLREQEHLGGVLIPSSQRRHLSKRLPTEQYTCDRYYREVVDIRNASVQSHMKNEGGAGATTI